MKKLLCLLLAALSLAACAGSAAPQGGAASPAAKEETAVVRFTDALGREVSIGGTQRTAALIGSFAEVWCLAGGRDTLVAAAGDAWTQFSLNLPEGTADLGAVKDPSAETLLAAAPDFVIASANTSADVDLLPTLEAAGIPVAYFQVSTFEDYLAMLKLCTELTGRPDLYEANGTAVQAQVDAARAKAAAHTGEAERVLYVRASASGCKVKNSRDSVLGEMLADLGCVNVADSDESLLENLSMEAVLAADPDRIFFVLQGSDEQKCRDSLAQALLSNPAWQQLTAVQNGACYYMDQKLYNLKPNARWGEAYELLAEILYGEEN